MLDTFQQDANTNIIDRERNFSNKNNTEDIFETDFDQSISYDYSKDEGTLKNFDKEIRLEEEEEEEEISGISLIDDIDKKYQMMIIFIIL